MDQAGTPYVFTGQEIATGYALCAERILGNDLEFINKNQSVIPIFVSLLMQSLEISIKHAGIESGLFTEKEARARDMRSGHGIQELAALAVDKLGGYPYEPIIMAMTHFNDEPQSKDIIRRMISGKEFEATRQCYASRCLGYGQVSNGGIGFLSDIPAWVRSIKETADNLSKTVDIIKQWKVSSSKSKHFAIWVMNP